MRAYERLLEYVKIDTQSSEETDTVPSTAGQFALAERLKAEMEKLGMERVFVDEHAYVYGFISASEGFENAPCIGFITHTDTAPDFSGCGVCPKVIDNYDGGDIVLGESGRVLEKAKFPELAEMRAQTLIVTNGETLLGADDKAGVAEIMTMCERLIREKVMHCALAVCFTPDEEIGHGAALLDLARFGADFAYTIDGGAVNEINFETFNAASACFEINGVSVHPGSAKDIMKNAALIACEINSLLPENEIPARTEGYEGFYHLLEIGGDVDRAHLRYIVRDHDAQMFKRRCERLEDIQKRMNDKYGEGTVQLTMKEQYRNMAEVLRDKMDIVFRAERAINNAGLKPVRLPVRGGTDGAQLSFRGLPCPNLGTGGFAFHGPYEHISAEAMDKVVDIITSIVSEK